MKSKIKFLLATIMMLVGVTATHAEDITSNIRIDVSTFCTDDNGTVTSYLKDEYTVKEGVVVTFRCLKSWDETVTIYLNGTAVATWPGDAGGSKYVWTAKKDAKINWKGYDQYSANIYLTETSTVDVTGITLDPATADMTVGGETLTLTPTVLPDNATDKTVTWTSSDESVATVANGVVTAVAPGTATITVTTTDGAKTATCTVTVAEPTYTVTVKEGTEDAANWTITPAEATTTGVAQGTEVTATYGGVKKVKSVKAVKKAKPAATVTNAPTAKTGVKAGEDVAIVNEGTAEGGTMMYMVNATQPASTDGFSATVPTAEGLTAGTYYVWYYVKADDSHTDSEISATGIEVTIAACPVTYTALSGGEVLHVGDIIEVPVGKEWYINNAYYLMPNYNPFTVVRANITGDEEEGLTVTEAADGAYYVIKNKDGEWFFTGNRRLPVTGTSDGIYVTYNGVSFSGAPKYTFSVHEP